MGRWAKKWMDEKNGQKFCLFIIPSIAKKSDVPEKIMF
jgi:hypothetical protein